MRQIPTQVSASSVSTQPLDGVEGQATQRKVYFFSPNGLGFGDVRLNVKVDQLPDMRYDYQFYFEVISAAVRFDIPKSMLCSC